MRESFRQGPESARAGQGTQPTARERGSKMKTGSSFENAELRAGRLVTREWEPRVRFRSCAPLGKPESRLFCVDGVERAIQKGQGAVHGPMLAEPVLNPGCRPSALLTCRPARHSPHHGTESTCCSGLSPSVPGCCSCGPVTLLDCHDEPPT